MSRIAPPQLFVRTRKVASLRSYRVEEPSQLVVLDDIPVQRPGQGFDPLPQHRHHRHLVGGRRIVLWSDRPQHHVPEADGSPPGKLVCTSEGAGEVT